MNLFHKESARLNTAVKNGIKSVTIRKISVYMHEENISLAFQIYKLVGRLVGPGVL